METQNPYGNDAEQPSNPYNPQANQYQPPMPPQQAPKEKKPWYKIWWVWVLIAVIVIGGLGNIGKGGKTAPTATATQSATPRPEKTEPTAEEIAAQQSADAAAKAAEDAKKAEEEAAKQAEADAAAAAEAARLDPASYTAISARDWQLIEKDPDSHAGENYVIYGHVTQADAATGTEGFRANSSGEWAENWYDYQVNTIVIADPEIVKTIVTDDLVTMYVTIIGAQTYDTQIGGSTTAPMVMANIVEVTGSAA